MFIPHTHTHTHTHTHAHTLSAFTGPVHPQMLSAAAGRALDATMGEAVRRGVLTEPQVARTVVERLPHGSALFLGNSMPIRDVDFYSGPFPSDGGGGGSPNALNGGTGLGASGSGGGAEETQVGDSTPEAQPLLTLPASSGRCTSAGLLG